MTEHAGETRQGLLWQQEHLAPLPIPTGQPARDLLNLIWRKNAVYLDIGSFAMGAGFITLHAGTFMCLFIALWVALNGDYMASLGLAAFSSALMGFLWFLFIRDWKKPLRPPLRFNRQRREVCVTEEDGHFWFVPWERVHAIAPSVTSLGSYGASKHGSLVIWLPLEGQENAPYTPDTPGWVMLVNPGGGISSMAQWECIRSFMETGPESVPEPSAIRNAGMSLWQSFAHDFRQATEKRGLLLALLWEGLGIIVFNGILLEHLMRKKLANLPDLKAPAAIEWSKPLPPEQWARRSAELEQAIAMREAELAAAGKAS